MRVAGMGSGCMQDDMEFDASGHHRFGADGDFAGRIVRIVMRADDRIEVFHRPGGDDAACALSKFLGGLEHQSDRTGELVAMLGEPECGAEQTAHMQVMAAAVHDAVIDGRERQSRVLLDRQAVDIRPQADDGAVSGGSVNVRDHSGLQGFRQPPCFDAMRMQQVTEVSGGFELLKTALGMSVQMVADIDEFRSDRDLDSHGS